ncbi:MAG: MerR family DNA-binding protein [Xanthomonadales bacterium]|nr:MerR family DNA-binding protein [Xanthomonadales bacterium]
MNNNDQLTIGKLAKLAGVNVETIRYYQRIEMIREPTKPMSGFRHYDASLVNTIKFIKRAQQLGFVLAEIKELLNLGERNCHDVKELAIAKRQKIIYQLKDLNAMKKELDGLIDACEKTEDTPNCALIDSLAKSP